MVGVIVEVFANSNERAWPVGGCVRDSLLGREPKDIDLAVTTNPERTALLVERLGTVVDRGSEFGTIAVIIDGQEYELTTLRGETYTPGSRHPEVSYGVDLHADLARRDLTIGAIAAQPDGTIIDPYGGYDDLMAGVVRCVGDPDDRFGEDPLRIVRAARFASMEPRTIDAATAKAMAANAGLLSSVSVERKTAEIRRVISSPDPAAFARFCAISDACGLDHELFGASIDLFDAGCCTIPQSRLAALHHQGVDMASRTFTNAETATARAVAGAAAAPPSQIRAVVRTNNDDIVGAANELRAATGRRPVPLPNQQVRDRLRAPLPINGDDLTRLGVTGPAVGEALRKAGAAFVRSGGTLDREAALAAATKQI